MGGSGRVRRAIAVTAAVGLLAAVGCTSREIEGRGSLDPAALSVEPSRPGIPTADPAVPVTLTVELERGFGLQEAGLLTAYRAVRPNVRIRLVTDEPTGYWPKVAAQIAAGTSGVDVFAIPDTYLGDVTQGAATAWTDLGKVADEPPSGFYDWALKQGSTNDGRIVALPLSIGPAALCYRKDLFARAGLPTDPAQVAALAHSWPEFLDQVATRYKANAPAGSPPFLDSAGNLFRTLLASSPERYHDAAGTPNFATNRSVRAAWDRAVRAVRAGLVTRFLPLSPPWWDGLGRDARFATVVCAPWMAALLKRPPGGAEPSDQWAVTAPPEPGGWGASYLGIPGSSKNARAAYDFLRWLAQPAQQAVLFRTRQMFPPGPDGAAAVRDVTEPAVGNARVGTLYGQIAPRIPAAPIGPKTGQIETAFAEALNSMANGANPDAAWRQAVQEAGR